jgi:Icc-related predicted phosphoesterase
VPVVAVLGNHDYHLGEEAAVTAELEAAGIIVLEGTGTVVAVNGVRVGVAGVKGFGGGFSGACATEFGEPLMKLFVNHTRLSAGQLKAALEGLDADLKIALLHYAPVPDTLKGERLEIHAFLGSYLFEEAADEAGADLILHGHAHGGVEKGETSGGIPVRNVALTVIRRAYALYTLDPQRLRETTPVPAAPAS